MNSKELPSLVVKQQWNFNSPDESSGSEKVSVWKMTAVSVSPGSN